jgi:F-type H+-transporting ATPase subunit delta
MKSSKSSIRYAQALLDLASEQKVLDAVAKDMRIMASVCNENRDFVLMLESPIVKADKKIAVLNAVFDAFTPISKSFVELITRNGRESHLPEIATAFDDLMKKLLGITPISIISAKPLDNKVKESIIEKVKSLTTDKIEVTEKIDESLIGGFIVRMGDNQIDASVSSQLNKLKQRLTK